MVHGHASCSDSSFSTTLSTHQDEHQLSDGHWRQLQARRPAAASAQRQLWSRVRAVIDQHLTQRQREVMELYFLKELDQGTVATLLGISQQSVSEHLYGKTRDGTQVGGLIRKLQKLCAREGIVPQTWSSAGSDDTGENETDGPVGDD